MAMEPEWAFGTRGPIDRRFSLWHRIRLWHQSMPMAPEWAFGTRVGRWQLNMQWDAACGHSQSLRVGGLQEHTGAQFIEGTASTFLTAASELHQTAQEAAAGLCCKRDYGAIQPILGQLRRDLHNTIGHLEDRSLAGQLGPAQKMADALIQCAELFGLQSCLHQAGLRRAIRSGPSYVIPGEWPAAAAVRAVGEHVRDAAGRWQELAANKAMKAALDSKLRQGHIDGGRDRDLRRQGAGDARPSRATREVQTRAREIQDKMGVRDPVCYAYIETGKQCAPESCRRVPCSGKHARIFAEAEKALNRGRG